MKKMILCSEPLVAYKNRIIVVYGPTASGKSEYAVHLAKNYNGVIINADSLQLFHDLPLLTARPTNDEQAGIEHFLYGILGPHDQPNAMKWRQWAVEAIHQAWENNKTPIVVGGTGFYLLALLKGLSPIPEVPEHIMNDVAILQQEPNFHMCAIKHDPLIEGLYHPNDHKRIARALSVYLTTKKSITTFFNLPMIDPYEHYATKIYIAPDRALLYSRIHQRFNSMIHLGAIYEVDNLIKKNVPTDSPLFNALGAKEIVDYLDSRLTYEQMIELSCQKSRQYAKRQFTFFNNKI